MVWFLAYVTAVVFLVGRSPVGQRYDGRYPRWVARVAGRRPPQIVDTRPFEWAGWIARRLLPCAMCLMPARLLSEWLGHDSRGLPTAVDGLTVSAVAAMIALTNLPFSKARRNGPLSLWAGWIFGVTYLSAAGVFLVGQWAARGADLPMAFPLREVLDRWVRTNGWGDAVGLAAALAGIGLALLAVVEAAPHVGSPETTPEDLAHALAGEGKQAHSKGSTASRGRRRRGANRGRKTSRGR